MRRLLPPLLVGALLAGGCAWTSPPLALDERPVAETSKVLAGDGTLVTTLHGEENRETVPLDAMALPLRDAVVAIEDSRYWTHNGVDTKAVLRALYTDAGAGRAAEGGSTITEQYVKNELAGTERTARRKLREAMLALQVEKRYSKKRILELYLNTIYFGNGAYGVQAAADEYFGATADHLTLGQSALLAGLIQAPSATDPYARPDLASARRAVVLERMVQLHLATPEAATAAAAEPLLAHAAHRESHGPAPFFVERVKRFVLDDPRFGPTAQARRDLLFRGGLRITTTLDLRLQAAAEAAVAKVLAFPGRDPAAAVVSLEPKTGAVRAIVGGPDFYGPGPQAKFDLATQGRRPAGSSFKPFVLAAALERGVPLTRVYDAPPHLSVPLTRSTWEVSNFEGEGGGRMNLIDATVHSTNTVYAQLIVQVGPASAVATAAKLGITSPLAALPSAVLGTNDVTPFEMASAYATFADRGVAVPPVLVTKIERPDGSVLYEAQHTQKRVIKEETADAVTGVLQQVVNRGTGVAARIGRPVAGKTGTGEEYRDAWFVGYTPDLVTSVWVGFAQGQVSMTPPATRILVTGATWPAQIWQLYSSAALAGVPVAPFADAPAVTPGGEEVPLHLGNVVGEPVEQAEADLVTGGFRALRHPVPSDDYPPGYVVAQSPPAGADAAGGTEIVLDVSNGPASASVPDLLDATAEQAKAQAAASGVRLRLVTAAEPRSAGSAARAGRIWKQTPQAGTRTDRNATVTATLNPGAPGG